MDQTFAGSRPRATDRDDVSYLDFVEGALHFVEARLAPVARRETRAAMDRAFARPETTPNGIREIRQVLDAVPIHAVSQRLSRTVQEMIWQNTYATLKRREPDLLAELDRFDRLGPSSVEYDPNFAYPSYVHNEFHLDVGGYVDTPIAGYVYHLGGNIFHSGTNDRGENSAKIVNNIPIPKDGRVNRVLETACAVGLSSIPLKQRFPNAEVIATDVSAPLIRYAHKRAVEMGLDIQFKQLAAEALRFPDNSFDIVFVHILFHELPDASARRAVAEAYRVLRPGGLFVVSDIKDQTQQAPGAETAMALYSHHHQVQHNGEIFHIQYFQRDMAGMLRDAGFRNVVDNFATNDSTWAPNLALPLRVGEK